MAESDLTTLPPQDGDAPLHELTRDQLSAFLYACFTGEELLQLCREAKVQASGGYRIEALDDLARADLLADELRAVPSARAPVLELLRKAYEFPALSGVSLPPPVATEMAALAVESDAMVRLLWRLLADPSAEVRAAGRQGLEVLADEVFGPPGEAPAEHAAKPSGPAEPKDAGKLRREARRAGEQAERAREKVAALKEQLRAARAEAQKHEREAGSKAKEVARLSTELARVKEKLEQARQKARANELEKLEKERAELAARVATLDGRLKEAVAARQALADELGSARKQLEVERQRRAEPAKVESEEDAASEPVPSTWLLPRFTREFYDSLDGWDPRIQRAAYKQAFLLAENHRHPSLRAIPLEGIPGYYRVRIATDVRLIYRRSENEREVEILSLIDREDLDRYVRQAKTR